MDIERIYREESGRILATLIRLLGSFDLAEDVLQEAFAAALEQWPTQGIPANPRAWLVSTARHKGVDILRRRTRFDSKREQLQSEELQREETQRLAALDQELEQEVEQEVDREIGPPDDTMPGTRTVRPSGDPNASDPSADDRLRLIFTCCHPALVLEAQVALTLRTLCGLSTEQIARAFLVPLPAMSQRLVRAKQKIRDAQIPYRIPPDRELAERLEAVELVIYLVFNEGYSATSGDTVIRHELCAEAIRLGRLICELLPQEHESRALLALMLLHDSRRAARSAENGDPVLLEEQNRALWNREEIREGLELVESALRDGEAGPYALQAAIAAIHARAATAGDTDWRQICALYELLLRLQPSPVVELNHAAAVAMYQGPDAGLRLLDNLEAKAELRDYYLLPAARADLLRRLNRWVEAAAAYREALSRTSSQAAIRFLSRRLAEVESKG